MPSPKKKTEAAGHTPGPWRIVGADGLALAIWGPLAQDVVSERGGPMRQEDARLIAAAPEMFAVCQMVDEAPMNIPLDHLGVLVDAARAALRKARGGA